MSCGDRLQWGGADQPANSLPDPRQRRRSGRFSSSHPVYSGAGVVVAHRAGRGLARSSAGAATPSLAAICSLVDPQYLSNGSLLGTNCLEPNSSTAALTSSSSQSNEVIRDIGYGSGSSLVSACRRSLFDRHLRRRDRHRTPIDSAAPRLPEQVDMARRSRRISDFSADICSRMPGTTGPLCN